MNLSINGFTGCNNVNRQNKTKTKNPNFNGRNMTGKIIGIANSIETHKLMMEHPERVTERLNILKMGEELKNELYKYAKNHLLDDTYLSYNAEGILTFENQYFGTVTMPDCWLYKFNKDTGETTYPCTKDLCQKLTVIMQTKYDPTILGGKGRQITHTDAFDKCLNVLRDLKEKYPEDKDAIEKREQEIRSTFRNRKKQQKTVRSKDYR